MGRPFPQCIILIHINMTEPNGRYSLQNHDLNGYLPSTQELNINKRPTGLNGHPEYQRLYSDFLSEGLIFAYQQPHHRVNKNQQWYRKAAS